jgi:hypothetical protein
MLETITSLLGGGLTGLVGSCITAFTNYKTAKINNEFTIKKIELEIKKGITEAESKMKISETETAGAVQLAQEEAYKLSQKVGNEKSFSERWIDKLFDATGWIKYISVPSAVIIAMAFALVDFLRGLMRPALTIYMTIMATIVTSMAWNLLEKQHALLPIIDAVAIYKNSINTITYLCISSFTWWFGSRSVEKYLMQNNRQLK